MQAFARIRLEVGVAARLVMPGLVALTGFHRRNDMHQARMIAAPLKHLGDHSSLRMWALAICSISIPADCASSCARSRAPRARARKPRIVETECPSRTKTPSCPAHSRPPATCPSSRCGRNRRAPHEPVCVPFHERLCYRRHHRLARAYNTSSFWFRLCRLRGEFILSSRGKTFENPAV